MNEEIILEKGILYRVKAIRHNRAYVTIEREFRQNKHSKYWKPAAYGTLEIERCTKIHKEWGEKLTQEFPDANL